MPEDRPVPRRPREPTAPETRLTSGEMEAVIARAIELQAREEERSGYEGIEAVELVRIAGELGISPAHVKQAIAEVRGKPTAETGLIARALGESRVSVSRLVPITELRAREQLDSYLREREAMVVQRRLPGRTVYAKGTGVGAVVARAANVVGARHPMLNARLVEVSTERVDERSCFVTVALDLSSQRSGAVAGTAVGGAFGTGAALIAGVVLAPPVALVGIPVVGGFAYLARSAYRRSLARAQLQIESLLDRLEHGELAPRGSAGLFRRFGL